MEQESNLNRRKIGSSSSGSLSQQEADGLKNYTTSSIKDTPSYLHREYILSGYRVEYDSHSCVYSLFHWHNETINVWTHIGGIFSRLIMLQASCFLSTI